ncbi:MAG: cold-shock protein [Alphaproteobacteria bacterium]|nr:cold-shock protein [Alphaproteobacteria bacterium]
MGVLLEETSVEVRQEAFEILGKIKWFNAVKGYGFIKPDAMLGDVFIHHSALRQAGHDGIEQGATVKCEAVRGPKGLQAVRVLAVDVTTVVVVAARVERADEFPSVEAEGEVFDATAKWFNIDKGYGFVTRGEGTPDVFIHIKVLRRVGIEELLPGQSLRVRVGRGPKGPQVAEIHLI